jgi:RimJ/RimL family protein N-acetyltransferase
MRQPQPTLYGDRFVLRAPQVADTAQLAKACQDSEIARFTRVPQPYSEANAMQFVAGAARRWADGSAAEFVVVDQAEALVGACGIVALDAESSSAEIGYWVAPWARHQGLAHAALVLLTEWAHQELGVKRLYLRIDQVNYASRRVATAAGFHTDIETLELEFGAEMRTVLTFNHWAE